jgi:hypothetical protein
VTLFLGLLFGAVGTVYFIYGKKIHDPMFLIVGFLLILYPYFFSNVFVVIIVGIILSAVPWAHQRGFF